MITLAACDPRYSTTRWPVGGRLLSRLTVPISKIKTVILNGAGSHRLASC
jgi:hypothetical protein